MPLRSAMMVARTEVYPAARPEEATHSMITAEIREITPQPSVAVRVSQPMAELDLASLFDEHLPNIAHRLADIGVEPAGPPYGRYHQFGPEIVDVEIGIPTSAPVGILAPIEVAQPGELAASQLPGGQVAITVHRGAYDRLTQTYDALHEWIHAQGHDEGPGPWESYVDDPGEVGMEDTKTEVIWPLG
jgi:effector-binding domain-containing protein